MDYCDVFISCFDSHSDGTHSLQRIHWWASDVMLHFSKSVLIKKQQESWMVWGWVKSSANLHFWWNYSFKIWDGFEEHRFCAKCVTGWSALQGVKTSWACQACSRAPFSKGRFKALGGSAYSKFFQCFWRCVSNYTFNWMLLFPCICKCCLINWTYNHAVLNHITDQFAVGHKKFYKKMIF